MSPSLSQLTLVQNTKILSSVLQQNHSSRPLHRYNKESKKNVVKIVVFGNKTRVQNQPASSKSILESEDTLNAQLYNVHGILHNCTQYFAQLFIVYYTIVHSILHNRTLDFASQKHTTTRKHSTSIFCGQMNTSDQHCIQQHEGG